MEGSRRLYEYCSERGIPAPRIGKLILATQESEVNALQTLMKRGTENGVKDLELVDARRAQQIQPGVRCVQGLWSPTTGITDYSLIAKAFAADSESQVLTHFPVTRFSYDKKREVVSVHCASGRKVDTRFVITAAGLFADKLSVMTGCQRMPAIVPFRGEYLLMHATSGGTKIRTNVYPVPDPRFPFLGVHFTPRLDGSVLIGPNAVFAFKREGYSLADWSLSETWESLTHSGFQSLAAKYFRKGLGEMWRSVCTSQQLHHVRRMVPGIRAEEVSRGPTGVRAQALDEKGNLVEDFLFDEGTNDFAARVLHVRNAPSPAATSSLSIASAVCHKFEEFARISQHNL